MTIRQITLFLLLAACGGAPPQETTTTGDATHRSPTSNAVTRWVEISLDTVRARSVGTGSAGRLYAMTFSAIFDAVNGIDRARHLSTREHAMVDPAGAPVFGDRRAAAAAAAHAVLIALQPVHAPVLDAALEADLAELGADLRSVQLGRDWGAHVGAQVVALRTNDGSTTPDTLAARTGIGEFRAGFNASLRNMAPFGVADASAFRSPSPPALTSAEYAVAFDDTKADGVQDGDHERDEIAEFWVAEAGTVAETGTWLQAALVIAREQRTVRSLSDSARLFALLGMANGDAVIAIWSNKAMYFAWRPTHAIREADLDGNAATIADLAWTSRFGNVGTSPEYPSGTSTFAGTAAAVLAAFYGRDDIEFAFEADGAPNGPRAYESLSGAAAEAGRSRIYQGVHFEFSNQEGLRLGRSLGEAVAASRLRRNHRGR